MNEEEGEEGFWLRLMSEQKAAGGQLPQGRRLLVLGDDDAEKQALVDRLDDDRSAPCSQSTLGGNGLEYRHLTVRDEYRENQAKLGVWMLDGDPFYRPLLKYALDADSLSQTVALVVAPMSRPWDLLDSVLEWTRILKEHIEGLDMTAEELERRKRSVLERYREYVEPGLSVYGSLAADNTREIEDNLGLELVVVVSRTECMRELVQDFGYEEEHFDFVQLRLRDFCLRRGAALFYVSVREDRNCDLLLKYLLHRSYGFPFRLPGITVERDAILVPAGWDTGHKVRFLGETLTTIPPDTPYRDVVFRPARMLDNKRAAPEVYAQGDQEFLAELLCAMERPVAESLPESAARGECGGSSSTATTVQRNVARRMARGGGAPRSPQKKRAEGADTTLSNFFHSLLNRRTSAPADRPLGTSGSRTYAPHTETDDGQQRMTDQRTDKLSNRHLSLDEKGTGDSSNRQLPEYFLSNPVCCSQDCSLHTESSSSSMDLEDQFSSPLDRVRSSFNPPLRTLLERPDTLLANGTNKEWTKGVTRSNKEQTDKETGSRDQTNGSTRSGEEQTDEMTRRKDLTNGVSRSSEEQTDKETSSRELTNGETRSNNERDQNEETVGHGLTNGATKSRNAGPAAIRDKPETVISTLRMPLRVGDPPDDKSG